MVKRLLVVEVYGHCCVVIEKTTIHDAKSRFKMSRSSKALVNRKTSSIIAFMDCLRIEHLKKKKKAGATANEVTKFQTVKLLLPR